MLNAGHKLFAYRFEGYWKDVGTIDSLWEANMDLLGKHPAFDIYGTAGHKIYARNQSMPSSYISKSAEIRESFVAEGCNIEGSINHSIISTGCSVGKGAEVTDSVIMPDVVIENGAVIRSAIIAEGCHVKAGARIGGYTAGGRAQDQRHWKGQDHRRRHRDRCRRDRIREGDLQHGSNGHYFLQYL